MHSLIETLRSNRKQSKTRFPSGILFQFLYKSCFIDFIFYKCFDKFGNDIFYFYLTKKDTKSIVFRPNFPDGDFECFTHLKLSHLKEKINYCNILYN